MKKVFVTVGTTEFQKLVYTIATKEIIDTLSKLGFDFIQIQSGNNVDDVELDDFEHLAFGRENGSAIVTIKPKNVTIKYDRYFENFEEQIKSADLVISHAGAGSCLDVLRQNKPLIAVVNEDLMDNHQTELAEQLQKNGHLYYCICDTLNETLNKDLSKFKPYPKPDETLFPSFLDKYCGFVN